MDVRDDENPFAVRPHARPILGKLIRAAMVLLACSAGVYLLNMVSQQWLISRLANDLEQHPPHVQVERLGMLADFGTRALPSLVDAVVSEDDRLSVAAFRVLSEMQGRWQTSGGRERASATSALVAAVERVSVRCPPRRHRRLAGLLEPVVLDTVESSAENDQRIYQRATQLLARLLRSAPENEAPRIARPAPAAPLSIHADAAFYGPGDNLPPLPTDVARAAAPDQRDPIQGAEEEMPAVVRFPDPDELHDPAPAIAAGQPTRASDALPEPPTLVDAPQGSLTVQQLQGLEYITDNPLSAYDTRSVIGFVASVQPSLRSAAEEELRSRGISAGDLEMAVQLMATDASVRLAMVDQLGTRTDVDPRRWLIWLASDAERDVRLEAIARLGTMDDPQVESALRSLLNDERDPTVATRLRRILGLR